MSDPVVWRPWTSERTNKQTFTGGEIGWRKVIRMRCIVAGERARPVPTSWLSFNYHDVIVRGREDVDGTFIPRIISPWAVIILDHCVAASNNLPISCQALLQKFREYLNTLNRFVMSLRYTVRFNMRYQNAWIANRGLAPSHNYHSSPWR